MLSTYGLTAKQLVIQGEDPGAYQVLLEGLRESYQPANTAEAILVEEIAQTFWRLQRARALEAENFLMLSGGADPVIPFNAQSVKFDNVRRYMTTIERAYHRAIEQLEKTRRSLRSDRSRRREPDDSPNTGKVIGFVSQKPAASPASDKLDDLQLSPVPNLRVPPVRLPDNTPVQLHSHPLRVNFQPPEHVRHAQPARHNPLFAVYGDLNGLTAFCQRHTI